MIDIIGEINRAIDGFRDYFNCTPSYLVLSHVGKTFMKEQLDRISGNNEVFELKIYNGLQIIVTRRRDIIFELF